MLFGAAPPIASSRSRISRTICRKSRSREPASRNIAPFTAALVVSGPGVNSSFLVVVGRFLFRRDTHHKRRGRNRIQHVNVQLYNHH
jgi:hypothetical protein